jgi:hypothetical protein
MIDFTIIETGNLKSLTFSDLSEYDDRPGTPLLEVKFPSLSQVYQMLIRPGEINIVTTKILCYNKDIQDFPDGVYQFRYSIEPNNYLFKCKNIVRYTKAKCKIKELLLEKDISKETIDKLYKLDILITASESIVDKDKDKALEYFNEIQKELKKIECDV